MVLPDAFTTAISGIFYDKQFTLYDKTVTYNEIREPITTYEPSTSSFSGNVRYENLDKVQESLGLKEVLSLVITCPKDTGVSNGDIIGYDDKTYIVLKAIPYDSHKLLALKLCELQSSILISA